MAAALALSKPARLRKTAKQITGIAKVNTTVTASNLPWRIAYVSPSLAGAQAAVRAGLGISVLPKNMVPADFVVLGADDGLPEVSETEIALLAREPLSRPAAMLKRQLVAALGGQHTR
jgi:DNA-binding transcriptional LysR family regulator